ncbi:hypothetical protein FB382_004310 [Nocardioides ginsengisegetis]|uniref:Uncharacterized protein n=1 Tax=Nocardioides ginsengisegetis TaxID=661491 RepID=A0A7W3PBL7_9ACTN|nr:hypothetical protein [Nocardioides ginsengisegetis]MBA8805965.1 hypothetical protein [Nocardioides ginsengisegetis]
MSSSHRPRQVTFAAGLIMTGSVLVVLTAWERISGLHTLETQDAVEKFLSTPPGDSLGLGVEGVLAILRVTGMIAAACATATAILGYQVLQRSRSARVGLSILALPVFVTGLLTGGLMSSMVAAASVMLWLPPARDWFNGREGMKRLTGEGLPPGQLPPGQVPPAPPLPPTTYADPPGQPRAMHGFGEPAGPAGVEQPLLPAPPTGVASRPSAVMWACLLAWVCSGLAIALMATSAAILAVSPGIVFDELHRQNPDLAGQGVSDDALRIATFVMVGLAIIWCLLAIVLGVLVWRRVAWARRGLAVSASAAAVMLLVATLGQPVLVLPLAAAVVTLALLVRPDVKAWFAATSTQ